MHKKMVKKAIIKELIKRQVIVDGTNIDAIVTANGLGGQPIEVNKNVVIGSLGENSAKGWDRCDAGKDHIFKVKYDAITAVEGMDVNRMAQAYKIKIK
jgi:hypothetical protein